MAIKNADYKTLKYKCITIYEMLYKLKKYCINVVLVPRVNQLMKISTCKNFLLLCLTNFNTVKLRWPEGF